MRVDEMSNVTLRSEGQEVRPGMRSNSWRGRCIDLNPEVKVLF